MHHLAIKQFNNPAGKQLRHLAVKQFNHKKMLETYQLKQLAEKVVPRKYLRVAGLYAMRAASVRYTGNTHKCPCCQHSFSEFASYGLRKRENALCRWCLSLERHRGLWLYLHERTNILTAPVKVLHFAPEDQFQKLLKAAPNVDYTSADLDMPTAMIQMDITNITFPDDTFDVILCNHVLEHVPDDAKAMSELYRVLKPGGWAILQTPISKADETFEDLSVTDPKQREKLFGQNDHVRTYGLDKKDRLATAGFKVTLDPYLFNLGEDLIFKYAILPEDIWLCRK